MAGMTRWLALLLLSTLAPPSTAAPAPQTAIHHCVDANGTPVFTDQPCSNLDAVPAEPATRASAPAASATAPRFCPANRQTLKKRVAHAFRAHDPNALAGLMLWHGHARSSVHTLRDLTRLLQLPFLGFADAPESPAPMQGLPPLVPDETVEEPNTLTLQLGDAARPRVSFAIIRRSGCLWLEP